MPAPAVLLLLVIAAGMLAYISGPLLSPRRQELLTRQLPTSTQLNTLTALLTERNRLYSAIMQLDSEFSAGTLTAQAYTRERHALAASAIEILQQLDALPSLGPGADDLIEMVLQRYQDEPA